MLQAACNGGAFFSISLQLQHRFLSTSRLSTAKFEFDLRKRNLTSMLLAESRLAIKQTYDMALRVTTYLVQVVHSLG